jgi:hypothetical protein
MAGHLRQPERIKGHRMAIITEHLVVEPMRTLCSKLTERAIASGHWMAQEKPVEGNAALVH